MQPLAVDRLGQIAGGAKRHAAALLVQDRHHDDGDIGELAVLPQRRQHRPAVEVGHHHVERDRDRTQFLGEPQSLESAGGGNDRKALGPEMIGDQLARGGIVVDDQNAIRPGELLARRLVLSIGSLRRCPAAGR